MGVLALELLQRLIMLFLLRQGRSRRKLLLEGNPLWSKVFNEKVKIGKVFLLCRTLK